MSRSPISMITGTGHAVPEKILTNLDLEKMVDTSDEWITTRTGIKERHVVSDGMTNSDLCAEAGRIALENAGINAEELDAIILGTVSGDVHFPATSCYIQEKLGAVNAVAFDLSAACSGFIYCLNVADSLLRDDRYKNILVFGAETLTRITNWEDRNTCVLFGDGAGAAVLQPSDGKKGILGLYVKSDGRLTKLLMNPGHYTGKDYLDSDGNKMLPFINMKGREVFKHAVKAMEESVKKVIEQAGVSIDDIDLLIPHQANVRIIEMLADRLKMDKDKVYVNIHKYGNTSAATIPIALDETRKNGKLPDGSLCLMTVFGGGFTWGAALVRF
ncbi:beta-ketoacyl-ACP synthase III [candidate division KSB1 bacterium]